MYIHLSHYINIYIDTHTFLADHPYDKLTDDSKSIHFQQSYLPYLDI